MDRVTRGIVTGGTAAPKRFANDGTHVYNANNPTWSGSCNLGSMLRGGCALRCSAGGGCFGLRKKQPTRRGDETW